MRSKIENKIEKFEKSSFFGFSDLNVYPCLMGGLIPTQFLMTILSHFQFHLAKFMITASETEK